jgi:hypothetical protein
MGQAKKTRLAALIHGVLARKLIGDLLLTLRIACLATVPRDAVAGIVATSGNASR